MSTVKSKTLWRSFKSKLNILYKSVRLKSPENLNNIIKPEKYNIAKALSDKLWVKLMG